MEFNGFNQGPRQCVVAVGPWSSAALKQVKTLLPLKTDEPRKKPKTVKRYDNSVDADDRESKLSACAQRTALWAELSIGLRCWLTNPGLAATAAQRSRDGVCCWLSEAC
ncbi:hypothetical protein JZ751_025991 [Albula glossodonta]|uniref:Uncharacterized protein n=1 Tax=Albula glossodonta TaxID=121402 RepID=A0A8T2NG95_9TELE|nr:hypothetical protein JZ751_025991 [Albula glossodonta]